MNKLTIGETFNNQYKVLKIIYESGNKILYKCHDNIRKRDVVLKVVDFDKENWDQNVQEEWDLIIDESVTASRLSNYQYFKKFYDRIIDEKNKRIILIDEYIDGFTLDSLIKKEGKMLPKKALHIFLQILNAIKILHNNNHQIIHRDLKPDNIMIIKGTINIKIIDFGISAIRKVDDKKFLTSCKNFYGTVGYIPPILERSKSWREYVDPTFDIFSVGIILYKMLVGKTPFVNSDSELVDYTTSNEEENGKRDREKISRPLKYDIPQLSTIDKSIPVEIDNILFKCIYRREKQYHVYHNAEEIIKDVENILNNGYKKNVKYIGITKNNNYVQTAKIDGLKSFFWTQPPFYIITSIVILVLVTIMIILTLI